MAFALSHFNGMLLFVLLLLTTLHFSDALVGVCYGRLGSGLPSPQQVVDLCHRNNIQSMLIYEADQPTLQALGGSNIEVILGIPNFGLQNIAASQANANSWVQTNVINHPNIRFRYIQVGNEMPYNSPDARFLLPAMQNIQAAISGAGLGNSIKVSTSVGTGQLAVSYPPSKGSFKPEFRQFFEPILRFILSNQAPLLASIYPYFSYTENLNTPNVPLEYALFTYSGVRFYDNGLPYQNLFDAQLDAMYSAVEAVVGPALQGNGGSRNSISVTESGWPSGGGPGASPHNAQTYNNNLVQHVKGGTPKRPGTPIETYIFDLFDEDRKSPDIEKNFGLFFPDGSPKYPISFS